MSPELLSRLGLTSAATFEPDYRNLLAVGHNQQPRRLPLYEHVITNDFIAQINGQPMPQLLRGDVADQRNFFRLLCEFFRGMTYDAVSWEVGVCGILPEGGALLGERPGPIQSRADFEKYPWDELPGRYWDRATWQFEMLRNALPHGMKALGGVGNGPFEISEDLVGYQQLCYMQYDDPQLFADLYRRIGDLLVELWTEFLHRYGDDFVLCRVGDDLGFKTNTLLAPDTLIAHVVPQYRRIIAAVHNAGKRFLWHSCGSIFPVMDQMIDAGIDAKHSNEDVIAPFDKWIDLYGDRIALVGGIDVDLLCQNPPDDVYRIVLERAAHYRRKAKGYALGSGNSIPKYVPVEGYLAMVRAAQEIRRREGRV